MIKGSKLYLRKARVSSLTSLGIVYALFASFAYGYSYNAFLIASILILVYTYGLLIINLKYVDYKSLLCILAIVVISIFNGFARDNLIDPIVISPCLLLPLSISSLDFTDADSYKRYIPCCLITILLVFLQIETSFLGDYNVNTLGFILYMGSSFTIVWLKLAYKKIYPLIILGISVLLMLKTNCRNAMLVMMLMIVLIFIPNVLYKKKVIFRSVYIVTMLYTIFVFSVLEFAFSNMYIARCLEFISSTFSSKTYGMDLRLEYFASIRAHLSDMSVWEKIWGRGINNGSGHNILYQGLFVYGILGTIIIYGFYIRVFEMAYKLFIENDDMVALGCFIGLIGNLLLQGADEYLICNPTCVVMPFIMVGLIMSRYRSNIVDIDRVEI